MPSEQDLRQIQETEIEALRGSRFSVLFRATAAFQRVVQEAYRHPCNFDVAIFCEDFEQIRTRSSAKVPDLLRLDQKKVLITPC
jgi:hypothetical protein